MALEPAEQGSPDADTPPVNLLSTAAGGVMDAFSSEFCDPADLPSSCEADYWNHSNIHDGLYARGNNGDAYRASWSSANKSGATSPEEFVFSFAGAAAATISSFVFQNYGQEGGSTLYYATHVVVEGEPVGGGNFFSILDEELATNEDLIEFDLAAVGGPVTVQRLRLSITASVHENYWELGEFEAWGRLR